jgi:hypothetical protein
MVMVRPVDLNGHTRLGAIEIQDVWPHGMLASEAETANLTTPQTDP